MYSVEISTKAFKALQSIPDPHKANIRQHIDELSYFSPNTPNVKLLSGNLAGHFRQRVGNYRIMFRLEVKRLVVTVIDVFHRGRAY